MTSQNAPSADFTLRDLFASLDQRKRPEDVAKMILSVGHDSEPVTAALKKVAKHSHWSWMTGDFQRSAADLSKQTKVAGILFAARDVSDPTDLEEVNKYLVKINREIGKKVGKNDYKHDRLNAAERALAGIDISRRQYNKRFRLAARIEDKARRRERELAKRGLTLASKSRLASKISWKMFSSHEPTACFIAYYVARCNLRSMFTVGSQVRAYDDVCETMMAGLRRSSKTNWFAIAHVMPDEKVIEHLTDRQKGELLGGYYEMLVSAGKFLEEVWSTTEVNQNTMIVSRGNDSSTWNLIAGAWNKLRDGWFSLVNVMGLDDILEQQCFGKVMRLMAADVMAWHRSAGEVVHEDTKVWAVLPLPWKVLSGELSCTREEVEAVCKKFSIDPYKKGWIARRGEKKIEKSTPTPELVHGVVVSCPVMAQAMRKAGIFSGKMVKLDDAKVDVGELIDATNEARENHWEKQTAAKAAAKK